MIDYYIEDGEVRLEFSHDPGWGYSIDAPIWLPSGSTKQDNDGRGWIGDEPRMHMRSDAAELWKAAVDEMNAELGLHNA